MQATSQQFRLMGTRIEVCIWHEQAEVILEQVESLLYLYKERFSANDLTSELMEVNLNAGVQAVPVADDLFELIAIGKKHSCISHSYLNIAIGPLVQTWRIGFSDARLPSQADIYQALQLTNPEDIELEEEQRLVYLKRKGMALDLGALAKGYIADKIIDHLQRVGVSSGFINLGGNVLTFGVSPHQTDGSWKVGIQAPNLSRGKNIAFVTLSSGSVVTSGIYERTFTYKGKSYHHILDKSTGLPITSELASLTIISQYSLDGEIWTSRLFGGAISDIYQTIISQQDLEAIMITKDGKMLITPGLSGKLFLADGKPVPVGQLVDVSMEMNHLEYECLDTDTDSGASEGDFGVNRHIDTTSGASVQ